MSNNKTSANSKGKCPKCSKTLDLNGIDANEIIFCEKDGCAYYSKAVEFISAYNKQHEVDRFKKDVKNYIKNYNGTLNYKFTDYDYCAVILWDKDKDRYVHYVKNYDNPDGQPKVTVTPFNNDNDNRLAQYIDLFNEEYTTKAFPVFTVTFPLFINKILDFLSEENAAGRYYYYLHPTFLILSNTGIAALNNGTYNINFSALPAVEHGDTYQNEKRQIAAVKRFLKAIDFKRGLKEVQIAENFIKRIQRKKFVSMDKLASYMKKDLGVIFSNVSDGQGGSIAREFEGTLNVIGDDMSLEGKYFCRQGIKERNDDYIGCGFFGFENGNIMRVGENNKLKPGFNLLSVFVVADGVSRSPHSDWASKFIVEYFLDNAEKFFKLVVNKDGTPKSDYFIEQALAGQLCSVTDWQPGRPSCNTALRDQFEIWEDALVEDRIRLELSEDKPPMSTLVLVYLIGSSLYYVNVGDSRLYHISEAGQVTVSKDITDSKGKLRGPMGRPDCKYRTGKIGLSRNDRIFIATDGVYSPVFKKKDYRYFLKPINEVMGEVSKIATTDSFDNMSAFLVKIGELN